MATFISFHIKSDNRIHITKILQELSDVNQLIQDNYPEDFDESILFDDNTDPTYIVIGNVQNGWTTVQINSFKKLHNWTKKISQELNTIAIQIIGQTVSDVYYFLMYDNGCLRREIEVYHGDFDNIIDKGEKFLFERSSLIPVNDEDYEYLFDRDTLEHYCKELGFDLFYDEPPEHYYILKKNSLGKTIKDHLASYKKLKVGGSFGKISAFANVGTSTCRSSFIAISLVRHITSLQCLL